jgi:hypothetical protein
MDIFFCTKSTNQFSCFPSLQLLYFQCSEALDHIPNHPILRPGQIVSIGLDKNTKLSAVFQRYVEFCNISSTSVTNRVSVSDLEFVHMQVLSGGDTTEASALMKNDKITVRKIRTMEREAENERSKIQREADKNFFAQMRQLLPDLGGGKTADVIFDCQGKLVDESGRNQQVLSTTVRGHSVLIAKRCPWLGAIIDKAKREAEHKVSRSTTPDEEKQRDEEEGNSVEDEDADDEEERPTKFQRVESDVKEDPAEEGDDRSIDMVFDRNNARRAASAGATAIEDDEEEDDEDNNGGNHDQQHMRPESPVIAKQQQQNQLGSELLWVMLPNHSPEAVKLLLEYCYTNRVIPLGQDAFVQSCKTKPHKQSGPVAPFHNHSSGARKWPNNGLPTVSFSVALAGISLAEEAGLRRLSLQCEIAASQLVSSANVVEALSMCTTQKQKTGNPLTKLQTAAMDVVLHSGSRGKMEIGRLPSFRNALEEKAALIVPALLTGTMEAVSEFEKTRAGKKHLLASNNKKPVTFDDLDHEDSCKRERERRKRRMQRNGEESSAFHDYLDDDDDPMDIDEPFYGGGWMAETAKRALKRMPHHLGSDTNNNYYNNRPTGFVRSTFPNFSQQSSPRTNRRRSSRGSG